MRHSHDTDGVFLLITLIPVFCIILGAIDFFFGTSLDTQCLVRDKDWHLDCGKDHGCQTIYTFEVQCAETIETPTSSKSFWYSHDTGDLVTVKIRNSRLLGMKKADIVE